MGPIILLVAGVWASAVGAATPSAQTILEAYASGNDKIRGFAVHYVEENRFEGRLAPVSSSRERLTSFKDGWFFQDTAKNRVLFRQKMWGQVVFDAPAVPKENADYRVSRWFGGAYHQYMSGPNVNSIARTPKWTQCYTDDPLAVMTSYFPGTESVGYFNSDRRRLDKKLAGARLSVSEWMDRVGEAECYVVEGQTRFGKIRAWFDPEKGFALAKYIAEVASSDISRGNLSLAKAYKREGTTQRLEVRIEEFTEVSGVWLPVKAAVNLHTSFPQETFRKTSRTIQMDSWFVNPDFDALRAFELNDIADDSIWQYVDAPSVQYRWNGGKLTPVTSEKGK